MPPHRPLKTLERVLSKAGLGSRKEARSWIGAGRVRVNGKVVQTPDHWVDPGRDRVTLDGLAFKTRSVDMVSLDDALHELAKLDQQQSRIVELRFFGGLSVEEISDVLKLSPRTVKRHWASARAWLHLQISATSAP